MKKVTVLVSIIICLFTNANATHKTGAIKPMAPVFKVTKAEIVCCGVKTAFKQKKVHVVSSAGWSVFTNVGLKIIDNTTATPTVVASYTAISGDFTTPCLNLVNGRTYSIEFWNGTTGPFVGVTQTKVAPSCPEIVSNTGGAVSHHLK